jgi:DNA polymerase III epsilon subunit-like protein
MKQCQLSPSQIAHDWLTATPVFLDTETTGLDIPEACEIAVINTDGTVLLNTLIRPVGFITASACDIHGINDAMVEYAPTFGQVWERLGPILANRLVVIYNANFDVDVLITSAYRRGMQIPPINAVCAMELYAQFHGEWNHYYNNWRWQRLGVALRQCKIQLPANLHRALADAEGCRLIVHHIASCI